MKTSHKLRLIPVKIKWGFDVLTFAMLHHKEVKQYKFLLDLRKRANKYMLKLEKNDKDTDMVKKLKIQIEVLDKIINYVDR